LSLRKGDPVRHLGKPQEPFAVKGQLGEVLRVAPSGSGIPAQAYVAWSNGDRVAFETWEPVRVLKRV
jgi:hypothetical protein